MLVLDGTYTKMRTWSVHMLVYTSLVSLFYDEYYFFRFSSLTVWIERGLPGKGTIIRPYPPGCGQIFLFFI